jgi:hypothetical protein
MMKTFHSGSLALSVKMHSAHVLFVKSCRASVQVFEPGSARHASARAWIVLSVQAVFDPSAVGFTSLGGERRLRVLARLGLRLRLLGRHRAGLPRRRTRLAGVLGGLRGIGFGDHLRRRRAPHYARDRDEARESHAAREHEPILRAEPSAVHHVVVSSWFSRCASAELDRFGRPGRARRAAHDARAPTIDDVVVVRPDVRSRTRPLVAVSSIRGGRDMCNLHAFGRERPSPSTSARNARARRRYDARYRRGVLEAS